VFFIWKYIKIIFFYFLNFIFNISISKQFKNTKKKFNFWKAWHGCNNKQVLTRLLYYDSFCFFTTSKPLQILFFIYRDLFFFYFAYKNPVLAKQILFKIYFLKTATKSIFLNPNRKSYQIDRHKINTYNHEISRASEHK
jgi:hypothetical protein